VAAVTLLVTLLGDLGRLPEMKSSAAGRFRFAVPRRGAFFLPVPGARFPLPTAAKAIILGGIRGL
jgi:hypothetical protein